VTIGKQIATTKYGPDFDKPHALQSALTILYRANMHNKPFVLSDSLTSNA